MRKDNAPLFSEAAFEAEKSVLGGLMLFELTTASTVHKVLTALKPGDFFSRQHRTIYTAIGLLMAEHANIDMLSVANKLEHMTEIDNVGGLAYLADLCKAVGSVANILAYVQIVQRDALRRRLHGFMRSGLAEIDQQHDLIRFIGEMASELDQIRDSQLTGYAYAHIGDFLDQWASEHQRRVLGQGTTSLTTGIAPLDTLLAPTHIPLGSLVVVGARPKMGKTAFLIKLAENLVFSQQNPDDGILSFSLEMPGLQLAERMVVSKAAISADTLYQTEQALTDADAQGRSGVRALYNHDMGLVQAATEAYRLKAYYVTDKPNVTIEFIERQSRLLAQQLEKEGKSLRLILVDYLTLMRVPDAERRDLALAEVTRRLKLLAKELNGIVIVVSQLSRKVEERQDKRPLPSDSRDSGQIEQDCDLWIGLYRDSVYHPLDVGPPDILEVLVRLNRHGGTGTAYCAMEDGKIRPYHGPLPQANRYASKFMQPPQKSVSYADKYRHPK